MIPPPSNAVWRELATGQRTLVTNQLGLQMLLKRLAITLKPTSPANDIHAAALEVHAFFVKYERILQPELAALKK